MCTRFHHLVLIEPCDCGTSIVSKLSLSVFKQHIGHDKLEGEVHVEGARGIAIVRLCGTAKKWEPI